MRRRRKRVNYFKLGGTIIVLLIVIMVLFIIFNKPNKNNQGNIKKHEDDKVTIKDMVGELYSDYQEELTKLGLDITLEYAYDDLILKDKVISQSIDKGTEIKKGDKLTVVISKGKLDKEKLKNDGINELGNVPIMMYHGIKNIKNSETPNTGGNVDKDGYTRTAEAFRNDLEFYYEKGYRMVKLTDYIHGVIDTPYGKSPIVLTFDDGNDNNIKVTGLDSSGEVIIDPNSAVGILEEFKKKYPDYGVTAIFFITDALFNQPEYNEKILSWLIKNGYEIGNHTKGHDNLSNTSISGTEETVGYMYNKLEGLIGDKYAKIVALPFGSPYVKSHANYEHVLKGTYNGKAFETEAALRVGWEPEVSPFNKDFDKTFLKRCRAYDNNGVEFDIDMVFNSLLKNRRYVSDGDSKTIVVSNDKKDLVKEYEGMDVITY